MSSSWCTAELVVIKLSTGWCGEEPSREPAQRCPRPACPGRQGLRGHVRGQPTWSSTTKDAGREGPGLPRWKPHHGTPHQADCSSQRPVCPFWTGTDSLLMFRFQTEGFVRFEVLAQKHKMQRWHRTQNLKRLTFPSKLPWHFTNNTTLNWKGQFFLPNFRGILQTINLQLLFILSTRVRFHGSSVSGKRDHIFAHHTPSGKQKRTQEGKRERLNKQGTQWARRKHGSSCNFKSERTVQS